MKKLSKALGQSITDQLRGLRATSNPSILRKTSKKDLLQFGWNNVYAGLKERAPVFLHFIESSVQNPYHSRNVCKKGDTLIPPMCNAASQLIAVFNMKGCVPPDVSRALS